MLTLNTIYVINCREDKSIFIRCFFWGNSSKVMRTNFYDYNGSKWWLEFWWFSALISRNRNVSYFLFIWNNSSSFWNSFWHTTARRIEWFAPTDTHTHAVHCESCDQIIVNTLHMYGTGMHPIFVHMHGAYVCAGATVALFDIKKLGKKWKCNKRHKQDMKSCECTLLSHTVQMRMRQLR